MHDAVAVDASDPAALHRVSDGMEHAEPHGSTEGGIPPEREPTAERCSGLGVYHDIRDRRHGAAHALLDRARLTVRVRE